MPDPRIALFQRKGGATPGTAGPTSGPTASDDESAEQPHGDNSTASDDGGMEPILCPQCGCAIDPATGEALDAPMGGPPPPDAGAPPPELAAALAGAGAGGAGAPPPDATGGM